MHEVERSAEKASRTPAAKRVKLSEKDTHAQSSDIFAEVVLDIPTRSLDRAFTYRVPQAYAAQVQAGTLVIVFFGSKKSIGYVVGITREPKHVGEDRPLDLARIKPLESIVGDGEPCFTTVQAKLALWMAKEYAAPVSSVFRLFLPPGQAASLSRAKKDGFKSTLALTKPKAEAWVCLSEGDEKDFETVALRKNAYRQREILEALLEGPQKVSELAAFIPGARSVLAALEKKGLVKRYEQAPRREDAHLSDTTLSSACAHRPDVLTTGQSDALAQIKSALQEHSGKAVLIHGITGSGKSEVYLEAIEEVYKQGQSAIVLIPEIALTAQTVGRFRSRFQDAVAVVHSRLSTAEKLAQYERIKKGQARVVIGARSALFAPVKDLGLIVIDEEHETSYKQDQAPRYVARDVAKKLAEMSGATLVLGSATPSLEALYNASTKTDWQLALMQERPGSATLPEIHIVDMKKARLQPGATQVFSRELKEALKATFARQEKSVLLLNRRGFATFLMCAECGCVPECPHCSTSLTYHERTHEMVCHTCGTSWSLGKGQASLRCPACSSAYLAAYGVGTQRVEDEIAAFLPEAPLFRMDADTTKKHAAHERILEEFDATPGAILLGTQMIAKGLDFPEVTTVGVINADTTLKLPDMRAPERTFNLLQQVAGRAGRGEKKGQVYIQTFWPSHPAILEVSRQGQSAFAARELSERKELYYPPFSRLGNITVSAFSKTRASTVVYALAEALRAALGERPGWQVLGPSACIKAKVKDRFRFHVLVKAPQGAALGKLFSDVARSLDTKGTSVALDVDAYDMF